ncbi:MAG: protein kinase [Planctomycetaceae bacterium]|nr:protein kinase [Planctomycetaceae bacterium]
MDDSFLDQQGACRHCGNTFRFSPLPPNETNQAAIDFSSSQTKTVAPQPSFSEGQKPTDQNPTGLRDDTSFSVYFGISEGRRSGNDTRSENQNQAEQNPQQAPLHFADDAGELLSDATNWKIGDVLLDVYEVRGMPNGKVYAEGGVGVVHRVYHREWDVELALKSPKLNIFRTENGRLNYERECRTWIDLGLHPNIVTCYLIRRINGIPRLFAELVPDGSLSDWIRSGRLYEGTPEEIHKRILDVSIQFAWGLDYAHRQGVLHLDIKPANVMFSGTLVKVTDFGLARAVAAASGSSSGSNGRQTIDTIWEGMTPGFCSPEQFQAYLLYQQKDKQKDKQEDNTSINTSIPPVTRQTDIWSWGVSVLMMFFGRPPCKKGGHTAAKTFEQYLKMPPPSGKPKMSEGVIAVLRHCFQENPEDRPKSMSDVAQRLIAAYQETFQTPYRRTQPVLTALTPESMNNHAVSHIDLGNIREARESFTQALRMCAWQPQVTYNEALLDWRTGKKDDLATVAQLESLVHLRPEDAVSRHAFGLIQRERGNIDESVHALQHAVEIDPQEEYRRHLLATKELAKRPVRCIERFRICPLDQPFVYLSPNEDLILFALSHETVAIHETGNGHLCARFRRNKSGTPTATNTEKATSRLALSRKGKGWVGDDTNQPEYNPNAFMINDSGSLINLTSGLLHDMLFAGESFSVLSEDLKWELTRGTEKGTFQLHQVRAAIEPVTFRHVVWNKSEEQLDLLLQQDVTNAVSLEAGVRNAAERKEEEALESDFIASAVPVMRRQKIMYAVRLEDHKAKVIVARAVPGQKNSDPLQNTNPESHDTNTSQAGTILEKKKTGSLIAHEGEVHAAYTTPDGRFAVTGGNDRTVRFWMLESQQCVRTFRGGEGDIKAIYVSRDRQFTLSLADGVVLKMWDTDLLFNKSKQLHAPMMLCLVASLEELTQKQQELAGMCNRAKMSAAAGDIADAIRCIEKAKTINGWETVKGEINQWELFGRFSIRSQVEETLCKSTFPDHGDVVSSVAISYDGNTAVSAGRDHDILVWNLLNGHCEGVLSGHYDWVRAVDLTSDGRFAVSGSWDLSLRLWNVATKETIRKFDEKIRSVNSVIFSPNARTVAASTALGHVYLIDPVTGKTLQSWVAHEGSANSVRFSRDGRYLVTGGDDGKVRIWDMTDKKLRSFEIAENISPITAVWPTTTLSRIAAASRDGVIRWFGVGRKPEKSLFEWKGHLAAITSLVMTPDDRWIISGSKDKTVRIWDVKTQKTAKSLVLHTGSVTDIALDLSASRLLSAGEDGTVRLWNIDWCYRFPGWKDSNPLFEEYLRVILAVHASRQTVSTSQSGAFPVASSVSSSMLNVTSNIMPNVDERLFRKIRAELELRGFGWIKPESLRQQLQKMDFSVISGRQETAQ